MTTPSESVALALAGQMLEGFDVADEAAKDFLRSVVASGKGPLDDLKELYRLSLMRGVEEWDMLIECATAIRHKTLTLVGDDCSTSHQPSLVPFLGLILTGRVNDLTDSSGSSDSNAGQRKRHGSSRARQSSTVQGEEGKDTLKSKQVGKGVSPFWAELKESSNQEGAGQHTLGTRASTQSLSQLQQKSRLVRGKAGKRQDQQAVTITGSLAVSQAFSANRATSVERQSELDQYLVPDQNLKAHHIHQTERQDPRQEDSKAAKVRRTTTRVKEAERSPFFDVPSPIEGKLATSAATDTPPSNGKNRGRPARGIVSSLPVPPLWADSFGLIQGEMASDPFRLLIAVTFLTQTSGRMAIPVFRCLMERFPTPEAVANADQAEIIALIRPLGLSTVRCAKMQRYAQMWLNQPPTKDRRYGVKNNPRPGDGRHVHAGQEFGPEPEAESRCGGGGELELEIDDAATDAVSEALRTGLGSAWEIGHLTQGPYALDSWRIFCRDVLLGRAEDWKGRGRHAEFQPEWMRVLPQDKELRACLRWMWMREGWEWDPLTGEREPLREEMRRAVDEGRVGYDDQGDLVILDQ